MGRRYRDLLAVVARASDVGMGLPEDHGARAALASHRIAALAGLSARDARDAVYVSLLRFGGCTADAHVAAHVMGDEVATRGAMYGRAHFADPREMLAFVWEHSGDGRGLGAQLAGFARTVVRMPGLVQTATAHCEVDDAMAERLGLDTQLRAALGHAFETWDGGGTPRGARGEALALPARVAAVADEVESAQRIGGAQAVRAIVRRRAGRALDPRLCALVEAGAAEIDAALSERSPTNALAGLAIEHEPAADGAAVDALCEVLADFADLKCAHTLGHSAADRHGAHPRGPLRRREGRRALGAVRLGGAHAAARRALTGARAGP